MVRLKLGIHHRYYLLPHRLGGDKSEINRFSWRLPDSVHEASEWRMIDFTLDLQALSKLPWQTVTRGCAHLRVVVPELSVGDSGEGVGVRVMLTAGDSISINSIRYSRVTFKHALHIIY